MSKKNDDFWGGIGFIALMIIFPPFGIFVLCTTALGIIAAILWPKVDKSLKEHYTKGAQGSSEEPPKMQFDLNQILKNFSNPEKDHSGKKKANWVFIRGAGSKQTYDVKCPDCFDIVNVAEYRTSWRCSNMHEFVLDFKPDFFKHSSSIIPNTPHIFLVSVEIIFEIMGHLAKSDGRVTEEEIECSVEIMSIYLEGLDDEGVRRKLRDSFRKGKDEANYKEKVKVFSFLNAHDSEFKQSFIKGLIALAYVDGSLSPSEKKIIEDISFMMNVFSAEELQNLFQTYSGYYHQEEKAKQESFDTQVLEAFAFFGCSPSDEPAKLKKKYFELCRKYHPDSHELRGATPAEKKEAEVRIKQVNNSWDVINAYLDRKKQQAA